MSTIYIVRGSTGYPEERDEWMVIAFADKEKAEQRVALALERAQAIMAERNRTSWYDSIAGLNEYDPEMLMAESGTDYSYDTADLVDPAPCPHVHTATDGTAYCSLAEGQSVKAAVETEREACAEAVLFLYQAELGVGRVGWHAEGKRDGLREAEEAIRARGKE